MEEKERSLKQRAVAGIFWKLLENGGTQGILFFVTILLARLLDPADYGVLTITVIFVTIANVFVQRGFSLSLVQKKDIDEADLSSVFYFGLALAALLYVGLFFAAPLIADYYEKPLAGPVLRVISLILFTGAVSSVQSAIIMRELAFRKRFIVSLISVLLSGTAGITLAFLKFGVWALVVEQLVDNITMCVGLTFATGWRPKRCFSFQRVKALFSFGWKLLVSSLLETLYSDVSSLIIGKRYNTTMLAQYDRGRKFPQYIGTNITGAIQSAMFPAFAIAQTDHARLKTMLRRSVATSAFVIFPIMAGLAATASPLVRLVLLEKWMPCVPFLQIFCITFAMYPVDATVLQAINGLGRSDVYLKLEIAKKICGILLLLVAVFILDTSVAIAWSMAITAVCSVVFNGIPIRKLIEYRYSEQLKDILPSLGLSIMMGVAVYGIEFLHLNDLATLLIQVPLGIVLYAGIAKLTKMDEMEYLIKSILEWKLRRQEKKENREEQA